MDRDGTSEAQMLAGRYELGPLLGHGGMGTVRAAVDRRLDREVAVKILRADLAEQPRARRRFESEAFSVARLVHPNIVTVYDSGEDEGLPFIVMERLPGRTLADEIRAGPVPVERARAVTLEILSALEAAHVAGIVHRDVKPGNVLLADDGHVKVTDFGIAKMVDDVDQTQTAELIATPSYLAPERIAGRPASRRSDLYSVGVLLYELLSGHRPFEGATPLAMMRAIEDGRAEPLTSRRPDLPPDIVSVVERAMSRDPDRRFGSATDMAGALAADPGLDATVPIPVAPEAVAATVPISLGAGGADATRVLAPPTPTDPVPPKRSRRGALAAGVALALVALGVGIAASRNGNGNLGPKVPAVSVTATTSAPSTTSTTTTARPAASPGKVHGKGNDHHDHGHGHGGDNGDG